MSAKEAARLAARRLYKEWTLHRLYPKKYRECAAVPVKAKKAVFLEVRMDHLTDSFREVYRTLRERGDWELVTCCLQEGMTGRDRVRKNCLAAIPKLADAEVIFVNDSSFFLSCLPLRPETTVIQLWHACGAFKKFGYSVADKAFSDDRRELERFPVHRNFSWVTVSSPEVVWAYAQAFHMEEHKDRIVPAGIARTDRFFDEACLKKAKQHLRSFLEQAGWPSPAGIQDGPVSVKHRNGLRVVLYAPTFRGHVGEAVSPDSLDLAALAGSLGRDRQTGQDTIVLCKHHPFVKKRPPVPEEARGTVFDVTEEFEIDELLMVSDICITDYSSLIFEYSLFERPMIFLADDRDQYDRWRGFYYPYEELTPGPVVTSTGEIIRLLEDTDRWFDAAGVHAFREKFMGSCDGKATERILKLIGSYRQQQK